MKKSLKTFKNTNFQFLFQSGVILQEFLKFIDFKNYLFQGSVILQEFFKINKF